MFCNSETDPLSWPSDYHNCALSNNHHNWKVIMMTTEGWSTPKYSLNRWPLLKVHHWAIILRFFVLGVFMCGPVFCPCLSVSVYICLCLLCALCLFVFIVFMCWSSLHMVANFRRCWKVQRQQLCLGTLPTWGSAQPRCKVNSFNFLHPSFRRN